MQPQIKIKQRTVTQLRITLIFEVNRRPQLQISRTIEISLQQLKDTIKLSNSHIFNYFSLFINLYKFLILFCNIEDCSLVGAY